MWVGVWCSSAAEGSFGEGEQSQLLEEEWCLLKGAVQLLLAAVSHWQHEAISCTIGPPARVELGSPDPNVGHPQEKPQFWWMEEVVDLVQPASAVQ